MARPQTYTDPEIVRAIEALMAEGGPVNPMRVKRRLGGGNVSRIKTLLAKTPRPQGKKNAELPPDLMRALERLARETAMHVTALASGPTQSGALGRKKSAAYVRERAQNQVSDLESELGDAQQRIARLETQQAEDRLTAATQAKDLAAAMAETTRLHAALRNSESDLRAARRVTDAFERVQRQDRDDIRKLQAHNESLVAELATLRAEGRSTRKPRATSAR